VFERPIRNPVQVEVPASSIVPGERRTLEDMRVFRGWFEVIVKFVVRQPIFTPPKTRHLSAL